MKPALPSPSPLLKRPAPPRQPELGECCNSGCVSCVFDRYEAALEKYQQRLALWEQQQAELAHK